MTTNNRKRTLQMILSDPYYHKLPYFTCCVFLHIPEWLKLQSSNCVYRYRIKC